MAQVISVSVPDRLYSRWQESGKKEQISPSSIFQMALETELGGKNQQLTYWSSRALAAEKKLEAIYRMSVASDKSVKNFLLYENDREQ